MHGIKFQSVVAPKGLIASLFGPVEGRRHDSGMLADSGDFCKNYRSTRLHRMGHPYAFMATLRTLCVSIYEGRSKALIDTSRTAVQQGHEPCQSFGRMAIWGHCELLCIPRLQQKLKNRLKSCWQNVHCVYQSTTSKVFWNRSTPNLGLQLGF